MSNKRERKVVSDVNVNEVPSLDKIKTKMDFSKHDFKELKEIFYSESKLKQACFKTFFITLIICIISSIIVIRIDNACSNIYDNILTRDEISYIRENNDGFSDQPICSYKIGTFKYIYIFEAKPDNLVGERYYYKINGKHKSDFKIYINDEIIEITSENLFGLLCTSSENEIIEIEIEYEGEKIKFSFSN